MKRGGGEGGEGGRQDDARLSPKSSFRPWFEFVSGPTFMRAQLS